MKSKEANYLKALELIKGGMRKGEAMKKAGISSPSFYAREVQRRKGKRPRKYRKVTQVVLNQPEVAVNDLVSIVVMKGDRASVERIAQALSGVLGDR